MSSYDIDTSQPTFGIGFFPSSSWELTQSDFGNSRLWTFNWLQAFWDTNDFAETPQLVVAINSDAGDLIANLVRFSYSGERIPIKGKVILASGTDRRGNSISSTPINAGSPTDSLSQVIAYGGQY